MNRFVVASTFVLAWVATAEGHQLDEYLQATRLDLSRDRVAVELSLTPGVSIASQVLALIDRDRDRTASSEEMLDYARRVMQDIRLTIDGRAYRLALTRVVSSAWDELLEGTGSIRLEAVAEGVLLTRGTHRIVYENSHAAAQSAYLVNALKPGRDLIIGAQRRDPLQHRIEMDVEVSSLGTRAIQFAGGSGLIALLVTLRLRARRRHQPAFVL